MTFISHPMNDYGIKNLEDHLQKHNIILTNYQIDGIKWLLDQEFLHNSGGILADDPGLGKTLQMLSLIYLNKKEKTLIVVPKSILTQWIDTFKSLFKCMNIYVHYGDEKKQDFEILDNDFDVCITTYHNILSRHSDSNNILYNQNIEWHRIIFDEGHILRNKKTHIYCSCKNLFHKDSYIWIVSGTPIQNSDHDMINLLNLVVSDVSGKLENLIDKYVLRRNKELLFRNNDLQKCDIINIMIPFSTRSEQNIYTHISDNLLEELIINKKDFNLSNFDLNILDMISKMRQAVIHPYLAMNSIQKKTKTKLNYNLDYKKTQISTKIKSVIDCIKITSDNCLVFCHYKDEMELLSYFLKYNGIDNSIFNGGLNLKERTNLIQQYNHIPGKNRVLIIQIKAGGVGLNLQQFSKVFIMSPDWNPANEIQAIARSHRKGQVRKVEIYKFTVCYNDKFLLGDQSRLTIDQIIMSKQKSKRSIMVDLLKDDSLEFKETNRC